MDTLQPAPYWKRRANCLNAADPDLFFGEDDKLPMPKDAVEDARKWCLGCPVARDCLIHSFQQGERYGIWGGFTVEERKRIRDVADSLVEALRYFDAGALHRMVVRL